MTNSRTSEERDRIRQRKREREREREREGGESSLSLARRTGGQADDVGSGGKGRGTA